MDLKEKSDENIRLVAHCMAIDEYRTSVASRIYYAIFQRMKHLLETESYDYEDFLRRNRLEKERAYSHGTIQNAFSEHVDRTRGRRGFTRKEVVARLTRVDQLYKTRIWADYHGGDLYPGVLEKHYATAVEILAYIDRLAAARDEDDE